MYRVVRDCLPEVMVKLKLKDEELAMWRYGKGIPGRGNSQGKGPETGT